MAKEITIMHFFSDKKLCEILIPSTKDNKDVVATVVVPLICWETNSDSIELELMTCGKIKKKILIIKLLFKQVLPTWLGARIITP